MNTKNLGRFNSKVKSYRAKLKKTKILAFGMSIVAIISIAGFIFSTDWGKKTCANIKKKANKRTKSIKAAIENEKAALTKYADDLKDGVNDIIEDIGNKTGSVKKNIKTGFHDVSDDISKTAENISDEIKKPFGQVFRKSINSKSKRD